MKGQKAIQKNYAHVLNGRIIDDFHFSVMNIYFFISGKHQ